MLKTVEKKKLAPERQDQSGVNLFACNNLAVTPLL
jgi:hypothetical protein